MFAQVNTIVLMALLRQFSKVAGGARPSFFSPENQNMEVQYFEVSEFSVFDKMPITQSIGTSQKPHMFVSGLKDRLLEIVDDFWICFPQEKIIYFVLNLKMSKFQSICEDAQEFPIAALSLNTFKNCTVWSETRL